MEVSSKIEVGQRMTYKGDMANASGSGAVVAVRISAKPGSLYRMDFGMGALVPIDDSRTYDLVLSDGRRFNAINEGNIGGEFGNKSCRFMLEDGKADAEEIAGLLAGVSLKIASDRAKADAKKAAFEKAKAEAEAQGRKIGLIPEAEFKKRGSAAAYNLRAELKAAGIKASVKQDGYTCINVWAPAEQTEAADAIARKYKAGNFDGMTDCYDYSPGAWGSVFGDVQYVFTYRAAA